MTGFAVFLVLSAAFVHAGWNFLAKRSGGGAAFVWLFGVISTCLYFPLAALVVWSQQIQPTPIKLVFMAGSGVLHSVYFLLLQRGYQVGDLSLVYPLARGTGPLLASVIAIAIFGEQPTLLAGIGILLIVGGVVLFTIEPYRQKSSQWLKSTIFALLTGLCISSYTLWDKYAVSQLLPPLLLDWSSNLTRTMLLTPIAVRQWPIVKREWRGHWREVVGVAVLCPLAYILVLTALTFSPVSYVAPMREVSIVIGAAMGTQLLSEGSSIRRLFAASLIVSGVATIALF